MILHACFDILYEYNDKKKFIWYYMISECGFDTCTGFFYLKIIKIGKFLKNYTNE